MKGRKQAQNQLAGWYKNLQSRTVDLIGDYAGNELFLVEGDSLILQCLDTDDIDLENGFQILHAVYAIESFLAALLVRKANFHIAFFDDHAHLCIPIRAPPESAYKYSLIREVVIRHLTENLSKSLPDILVSRYSSYTDDAFLEYARKSNLYFVMCHDGASSEFSQPELPEDATYVTKKTPYTPKIVKRDKNKEAGYRIMINWLVRHSLNIALINSVEWRDTKIMAMVQEVSHKNKMINDSVDSLLPSDGALRTSDVDYEAIIGKVPSEIASESLLALYTACYLSGKVSGKPELFRIIVIAAILSQNIALSQRRLPQAEPSSEMSDLFIALSDKLSSILADPQWREKMEGRNAVCDVADILDGRLISLLQQDEQTILSAIDTETAEKIQAGLLAFGLPKSTLEAIRSIGAGAKSITASDEPATGLTLLPFHNTTFDEHLESINVRVSDRAEAPLKNETSRIFQELTHWHNTRPIHTQGQIPLTEWQKSRALRAHQMFLRELQQYAASLTSAVGKSLDPEVIHVGKREPEQVKAAGSAANAVKAANIARLASKNDQRFTSAWQSQLKEFAKVSDLKQRYTRTQAYLKGLPKDRVSFLAPEVELYMLDCLVQIWMEVCEQKKQNDPTQARFAALLFDALNRKKLDADQSTIAVQKYLQRINDSLGLPFKMPASDTDRPLSFKPFLSEVDKNLKVPGSALSFQLQSAGPYMDRSFDSAPDPRVRFEPDAWQRRVLDLIDQKKSTFVVAPTSAGKTFISFYAMSQVLRESDDGVLVYVAPTKALVNQIAAELQAQFTKTFKYAGKTVWAIHTRDYRVNESQKCQILVTVPHILQIMLMSPGHAKANGWSTRIKRIIFDEIHSIGAAEDGVIWEQLLLLAPCPIIALSATVGNPEEFYDWMKSTQSAMGLDLEIVKHPYRYSDLRKFVHQPPEHFSFEPLAVADTVGLQSLDDTAGLAFMHPIASLTNESRGMPDDLHLEARDCLSLYNAMKRHETPQYPLDSALDPIKVFPAIVKKTDILSWEVQLKDILKQWMSDPKSPFHLVVDELTKVLFKTGLASDILASDEDTTGREINPNDLLDTTLPLLVSLNSRNALPAILFNYDRGMCEKIAQALMKQLGDAQADYKANSPKWKSQLAKYEKWKKEQDKVKFKRPTAKKSKKGGDDEDAGGSKADREREAAELEQNPLASFDPNGIVDGFSFANNKALLPSEFDSLKWKLERRHIASWLIDALKLGIGIHHAGMNRSYRQAVETLFRRGFLRVVIATGTLALGINMPCKTVVFSGDSIYLTALNYRQAAGRAGRRGFDILGNVVFQNISLDKVFRLVSSRLPDLNGHFPITTSLVLRLFSLLHDSNESVYAKKAINSLLCQPRLYLGGDDFRQQVLHHLRYSIEYLRRQQLIDYQGKAINFAGLVSHLYYVEPAGFAFHYLLKDGYFTKLCADFKAGGKSQDRILDTLMLVMSHIFGRRTCRRADQEFVDEVVKKYSSHVFLPRLPDEAEQALREHNKETLAVFSTYVKTFAEQHNDVLGNDHSLPLTKVRFGGDSASTTSDSFPSLPSTTVRSSFVALSGHGDQFKTIAELCRTARQGVWLEEAVIPHISLHPDESTMPLNAYLYDFYRHGDLNSIANANGIRKGDIWFLLNDFSLVLATVVTSFKNYMNVSADADVDMADVLGAGDGHEIQEDERIADSEQARGPETVKTTSVTQTPLAATPVTTLPLVGPKKKKEKVSDSWDDDMESDEEADGAASGKVQDSWDAGSDSDDTITTGNGSSAVQQPSTRATSVVDSASTTSGAAWDGETGEGLKQVALAFEALKKSFDEKFKKIWA